MAAEGLRPILASDMPPQLAALLEAAWQLQPEKRPSAAQLQAELKSIVASIGSAQGPVPLPKATMANGVSDGNRGDLCSQIT